jgi:hypothetical protein
MTKIVDRVPHMQEGAKIQSVSWAQESLQNLNVLRAV